MNQETKKRVLQNIATLESNLDISPIDAENIFFDVLSPLLKEEKYKITKPHKNKIDFIAQKSGSPRFESNTICIEYKHLRKNRAVSTDAIYQAIGFAQASGFDRAMVVTNTRFTSSAIEVAQREMPLAVELIDIDALKDWIATIEINETIDQLPVEQIIKVLSRCFAQKIAENPRDLDKLEWRDMERMLAEVFDGLGFSVTLTPGSKDGGKDIILECLVSNKYQSYIVEIKHWRPGNRVGSGAATDFLNVIAREQRQGGLYLSTYGYTENAFESLSKIEREKLKFGDEEKIVSLCKTYVKVASGIWSPQQSLIDVLYEHTG